VSNFVDDGRRIIRVIGGWHCRTEGCGWEGFVDYRLEAAWAINSWLPVPGLALCPTCEDKYRAWRAVEALKEPEPEFDYLVERGVALDAISVVTGLYRTPGETDADLRARCMAASKLFLKARP
jgi:hypothetical protein